MHRLGSAQQDGAHRHAVTFRHLDDIEQNVGRVQVGTNQQIGLATQRAVHQAAAANRIGQRRIALQFAIAFDVRGQVVKEISGLSHLLRRSAR